ncbi:hypothetical protein ES703_89021 [subsurface metagenome]
MRILVHVADGIEVDERRHSIHDDQHDRRQGVHAQCPGDLQVAGIDPGQQRNAGVVLEEADVNQREPGQRRGDEQQSRGDQFGRARTLRRRLGRMVVVVPVIVMAMVVMGDRGMRMGTVIVMVIDGVPARVACMGAENRDQSREDRAEQRQEDDCLIHAPP